MAGLRRPCGLVAWLLRSILGHRAMPDSAQSTNTSAFIWSIANLLRGTYKQADYGKVILPFTVLRRLVAVLEPTKQVVLRAAQDNAGSPALPYLLRGAAKQAFYNTSRYTLTTLAGDSANVGANLVDYVQGFSETVRDIFERYEFVA